MNWSAALRRSRNRRGDEPGSQYQSACSGDSRNAPAVRLGEGAAQIAAHSSSVPFALVKLCPMRSVPPMGRARSQLLIGKKRARLADHCR
jgi:hypothetical protein